MPKVVGALEEAGVPLSSALPPPVANGEDFLLGGLEVRRARSSVPLRHVSKGDTILAKGLARSTKGQQPAIRRIKGKRGRRRFALTPPPVQLKGYRRR